MRNLLFTCFLVFIASCCFGKTYLHCFTIKGKATDASGKALANEMLIFNPGKWNVDTVYTDQDGFYEHTVAYWPPCNRKASHQFWRSSITIFVSGATTVATIVYKPRKWMHPCRDEGKKHRTMTKNLVL
ncbi:MAG TPA: hypothetical protein VK151_05910 [Fluviicola sp.]|nr:hypothetical protein [Fluviicola sp.]